MNVWKISYLCLLAMGLGTYLSKHGEPKTGDYNFWIALISTIIQIVMLYFGGFFG